MMKCRKGTLCAATVAIGALVLGLPTLAGAQEGNKPAGGGIANPAFVFQESVDGGLFLATSDGSTTVRLTRNRKTTDEGATWSPDFDALTPGHQGWIAFFRQHDPGYIWGDLYIVPSDASGPPVLVRSFTDFETPPPARSDGRLVLSWSPDGSRILYYSGGVWAATVATGEVEGLFNGSSPHMSPDLEPDAPGYQGAIAFGNLKDVWLCFVEIDPAGELTVDFDSFTNLTQSPDLVEEHPVWSADGSYLAFSRRIKDADIGVDDRGLYALDLATGEQWRIVDTYYAQTRPTWSPDGFYIGFSAAHQVKGKWTADIFYVSPWFSSAPVNATQTDSPRKVEFDPAWNPAWVNDIP